MAAIEPKPRRVIRLSVKKIIWAIIIIVALIWLGRGFLLGGLIRPAIMEDRSVGVSLPSASSDYYPGNYNNRQPDITDTREFLKTSYAGQIKTRQVGEIVNDVKNAVRDVEGRVDSLNSSEKYGRVTFVVPKSRFEEFRSAVESLTHKKLY